MESLLSYDFRVEHPWEGILELEDVSIFTSYLPAKEQPARQLLLCVNGYQRTHSDFKTFRKKMMDDIPGLATLSWDHRYCGKTVPKTYPLPPPSVSCLAKDGEILVKTFLHALNLKMCSAMGISMGGMVCQTLAAQAPEIINLLLLLSTTAGGRERIWPKEINPAFLDVFPGKFQSFEQAFSFIRRQFSRSFLERSPQMVEAIAKSFYKQDQNPLVSEEWIKWQYQATTFYDGLENLPLIRAKTFLFSGDDDHVICVQNSQYLHQNMEGSLLIVYPQVGHMILVECFQKFCSDAFEILKKNG